MKILLAIPIILLPTFAEAARCPSGMIYRPSIKACWTEKQMERAGFVRVTRSVKRPKVQRPPVYRETFENHLWNYVEANRAELIRSYSR